VAVKVVAFKAGIAPTGIKPETGVTEIVIALIVTAAAPDLVVSDMEVAITLTVVSLGTGLLGAV
jgi:hypothetical protein